MAEMWADFDRGGDRRRDRADAAIAQAKGQELIDLIDQVSEKFWATAEGPGAGVYAP